VLGVNPYTVIILFDSGLPGTFTHVPLIVRISTAYHVAPGTDDHWKVAAFEEILIVDVHDGGKQG